MKQGRVLAVPEIASPGGWGSCPAAMARPGDPSWKKFVCATQDALGLLVPTAEAVPVAPSEASKMATATSLFMSLLRCKESSAASSFYASQKLPHRDSVRHTNYTGPGCTRFARSGNLSAIGVSGWPFCHN